MNREGDPSGLDGVPVESLSKERSPIDYIVVGSGPGGAPLACRLAQAGMRVLVLEAGIDPGAPVPSSSGNAPGVREEQNKHPMYYCPGLHAASTEPHRYPDPNGNINHTAWGFEVQHYSNSPPVYYPRASALGGCATHHAMITIYGLDYDWQRIADLTGDETWGPGNMRTIYQQIERLRYGDSPTRVGRLWDKVLNLIAPDRGASGDRGRRGWLDVTISDPNLALEDSQLFKLISHAFFDESRLSTPQKLWRLVKLLVQGKFYRDFDLNDAEHLRNNPEGIAMVPIARSPDGVRRGPRELLLETRQELLRARQPLESELAEINHRLQKQPADRRALQERKTLLEKLALVGKLEIATGILVCKVELSQEPEHKPPRAVGVQFQRGCHRYGAALPARKPVPQQTETCYCRREVILCAGAFNTPQLLMLSGIGDTAAIKCVQKKGESGPVQKEGSKETENPQADKAIYVHLPGVGSNLMDRYEISVISSTKKEFSLLKDAQFQPFSTDDPALNAWRGADSKRQRRGVYTSNGAVMALLKRSHPGVTEPDLLILGFPAAFRGYYPGWSEDLFRTAKHSTNGPLSKKLWSWVLLKAYTKNHGQVRLKSHDPLDPPEIHFRYFDDHAAPSGLSEDAASDMAALVSGVEFVRKLNRSAPELFDKELQPGHGIKNDSADLRSWIAEEAWGHHPCGTCPIGAEPWQADPSKLVDKGAVVDSKFCVHGVQGLRVVDASVFPHIPGYFIVTSIYMLSEKAAATILDELSF